MIYCCPQHNILSQFAAACSVDMQVAVMFYHPKALIGVGREGDVGGENLVDLGQSYVGATLKRSG